MQVFRSLDEIPAGYGPAVVSIGNFDGVHRAHQRVLKALVHRAHQIHGRAIAITFDPHPTRILRPDAAPKLLTPMPLRLRKIEETGVDAVLVLPFTRDLSNMSPREFVQHILVERLATREVHEGYNFHFGHKAAGDIHELERLGHEFGFVVKLYPEMKLRTHTVSSSEIRKLIGAGKMSRTRTLLGRSFSIVSRPGRGRGLGHKYTVPTINLVEYNEQVPGNGVYITLTRVGNETFDSVTNVGVRPTFGNDGFAIETHLLDFHPIELTAQTEVELTFLKRIRDEKKFPTTEALKAQIGRDVQQALRYFKLHTRYAR
ncbi:MAG TPA: bifunctional riboflavin kinase/FAD synthetase [Candidatus Koribacter sp.]|jgi:riboflavin kinase/FMN adenylyltransferase